MGEKVFHIVDGKRVPKPGNQRQPGRRYSAFVDLKTGESGACEFTLAEEAERDAEEAQWEAERPIREVQAREAEAKAQEYRASLKYEQRIVAFLDILGWEAAINRSLSEPELVPILGLNLDALKARGGQLDWMRQVNPNIDIPGNPQFTQFSDSVVFSMRPDASSQFELTSTLSFLTLGLLWNGFLVRGGITFGLMYHKGTVAFGPALIQAYKLEVRTAIYPRIILDSNLANAWGQGARFNDKNGVLLGYNKTWRVDCDGVSFFDYLQPINSNTFEKPSNNILIGGMNAARPPIERGLRESVTDAKNFAKWLWAASYFNDVCSEYPDANIPLIVPPKI